jgi:phosphoenolpyruvate-protein kinase (PTS system EI component)
VEAEIGRFREALARARDDLIRLGERVRVELGGDEADIFSAHIAFLSDRQFVGRVEQRVRDERVNVEQAIEAIVEDLAASLKELNHEYLREREQDIRDMGRRVLRQLARQGRGASLARLPPHSIVVAPELLPSDIVELDRGNTIAIVTEQGGEASHIAILARSLGIPAVAGVKDIISQVETGTRLAVDGQTGAIELDPSSETLTWFAQEKRQYDAASAIALAEEYRECVTRDSVRVHLYANGSVAEVLVQQIFAS